MVTCKIRASARHKRGPQGFTLIETMVAMTILAILAATALSASMQMMVDRRLEGKAREYVTHMNWARSMAISSNQAVNLRIAQSENASCYVVF